jgi:hypothetical protein
MRMNWEIRLQPNGTGTEVEQYCEIAPPPESPMARMVNEDLASQGREEVAANLSRLKSIIEGQLANS